MWLKKLVAVSMIITLLAMNAIVVAGIFSPVPKLSPVAVVPNQIGDVPVVILTVSQSTVEVGSFVSLTWSATNQPTSCRASGDWSGTQTAAGSASTGRLTSEGTKTYTLTCQNDAGESAAATATVTVHAANKSTPSTPPPTTPAPTPAQTVYCQGASPCYGPREVSSHNSAGNCWGYNGNRVINISGFDVAFHRDKSAIGSIEVGGVCGTNLAGSLGGSVTAGGQAPDHNTSSKNNADRNMIPYFVGYFDSKEP